MRLAIFDLDNTLLAGDSDHAWGEFLVAEGLVDPVLHKARNDGFYADYCAGKLDIFAYSEFVFSFLVDKEPSWLAALHRRFMENVIEPMVLPKAVDLVESHRTRGDRLLITTATNRFITAPIAARFGIDELLATDPEQVEGRYTGRVAGTPCYQDGKIVRFREWLARQDRTFEESWFYSDSRNDLPLLRVVDHPVAVNPDTVLAAEAREAGWPILDLREG